jgi:hypothetical protein
MKTSLSHLWTGLFLVYASVATPILVWALIQAA